MSIGLEGLRKSTKIFSLDNRHLSRDSNHESSEYKPETLSSEPTCPVMWTSSRQIECTIPHSSVYKTSSVYEWSANLKVCYFTANVCERALKRRSEVCLCAYIKVQHLLQESTTPYAGGDKGPNATTSTGLRIEKNRPLQYKHPSKKQNKLRGFSPPANYTDQATTACRRS
jgi:hypothetical protein